VKAWEVHTGQRWMNDSVPQSRRSSFPWERRGLLNHLGEEAAYKPMSEPTNIYLAPHGWRSRLPKDTFGDSLKKVNRLYNREFGYAARKVIAHMPHFIDVDIMTDLVARFPQEWEQTSSHRLRSGQDMQYAFAYFYYLMSVEDLFNTDEEFGNLDTDGDGLLSVHELRTLISKLYELPTTLDDWAHFEDILLNCSYLQPPMAELGVGIGKDAQEVWVTAALFGGCDPLLELYNKTVGKKNRYKFELESDENDIAFKMIRNNASKVAQQLDVIRREPKKFICLNDNIDHRKKSASKVVEALSNFYTSLFPVHSQFELPQGLRNRFLHVKELRAWRRRQKRIVWWSQVTMGALLWLILCSLYGTKLKKYRQKWLQNPFGRTRHGARATLLSGGDGRKLI